MTNFSDLDSPITPTDYMMKFMNNLNQLSKIRNKIKKSTSSEKYGKVSKTDGVSSSALQPLESKDTCLTVL